MQQQLLPKEIVSELDEVMNGKLVEFAEKRYISDVAYTVKSGKEATVFCCHAHPSVGCEFVAAKIYRPGKFRGYKSMDTYREGRVTLDHRAARAMKNKSRRGRDFQETAWTGVEFQTLTRLFRAGADVPEPILHTPASPPFVPAAAVLMEFLGDADGPAPMLRNVDLPPEDARDLFDLILDNIELWLADNIIHGDLSASNILYWEDSLVVIDFPQAVDPRQNPNAFELLRRDVENVCSHWEKYGVRESAFDIAHDLWQRWQYGHV
jgi:RIO kinase 1